MPVITSKSAVREIRTFHASILFVKLLPILLLSTMDSKSLLEQCQIILLESAFDPHAPEVLKHILRRKLEESGIRREVLEDLWRRDATPGRVITGVVWSAESWMIQKVESIYSQLEILLTPGREVLEERHIDTIVSRSIDLVGLPAKISNCVGDARHLRTRSRDRNEAPIQRIGKCARVIPVGAVTHRAWA